MKRNLLKTLAVTAALIPCTAMAQNIHKSWKVDDGNYKVTVTLGNKKKASTTWVRGESRRLFFQEVQTKKGEFRTLTFTVHKRSPRIDADRRVKLKDRELSYLNWDDSLTLDFVGDRPAVQDVTIEKDDKAVTLFLCGNSTVVDQENEPWASWGQMFPRWWDENVCVANYAESGERTTSFIAANRWAKVMSMAKKGDYIFVEFGHNDEKDKGPGSGAWYNFSTNLKRMIDEVRQKECNIVLVTPTARRSFRDGHNQNTHGDYPAAVKAVCERERVPLIDLTEMSTILYDTEGEEGSKRLLVHYPANTYPNQPKALADNTHFNTFGAYELSKCVVMGIKKLNLPIVKYLRADWKDFSPSSPDDWQTWNWPDSDRLEILKPDGN